MFVLEFSQNIFTKNLYSWNLQSQNFPFLEFILVLELSVPGILFHGIFLLPWMFHENILQWLTYHIIRLRRLTKGIRNNKRRGKQSSILMTLQIEEAASQCVMCMLPCQNIWIQGFLSLINNGAQ